MPLAPLGSVLQAMAVWISLSAALVSLGTCMLTLRFLVFFVLLAIVFVLIFLNFDCDVKTFIGLKFIELRTEDKTLFSITQYFSFLTFLY